MKERRKKAIQDMEEIKEVIRDVVGEQIQKNVNGKIDRLTKIMESHREEFKPILEIYKATNNTGKFVVWLSKIVLALGIITGGILAFFKYFIR